jgi:prepilin-type N-terminal cleavage/methylation domain-containing protein
MNNKGFTLIELISTIALLAIIALISFVSINGVIKNNKISNCENLVKNIKVAAREYVSDNRYKFNDNNNKTIDVKTLIDEKYLKGPIINPFTNEEISGKDISVKIELNSDYSSKEIHVYNKNGNEINCYDGSW